MLIIKDITMKKIILRVLSILFLLVFSILLVIQVTGVYEGKLESFNGLFHMVLNPSKVIDFPSAFLSYLFQATIQLFVIFIFYFIGRMLWKASKKG
jgi:hypothetical protein